MSREHYKPGVPSVTELLQWAGLYPDYPQEPTGYYLRRGHWVDQACALFAQDLALDDRTMELGFREQVKPLAHDQREQWLNYALPFHSWLVAHKVEFIAAQQYVYNGLDNYQGTLDLLLKVDGAKTLIDFWCGGNALTKPKALQTAGYALATMKEPKRLGLQLEPGKLTEHWYKDYRDYDAFRLMVRWYWRSKDYQ